jgi:uncharacterized membrane protein
MAGCFLETIFCLLVTKKFSNRKTMLILPICPVYGIGAVTMTAFLGILKYSPLILFGGGFLVGTAVEYLYSFFFDKVFKILNWDYSEHKYTINGRISLYFSMVWGFLAVVLLYLLEPVTDVLINIIPKSFGIAALSLVLLDTALTFFMFYRIGRGKSSSKLFPAIRSIL